MFACLIGESWLFRRIVTFLIIALYKYSYLLTYLLTAQFVVNNYLWQFYGITRNPRGGKIYVTRPTVECYKNTHMKADDKCDKYVA